MAFVIPNSTDTTGGEEYTSLDQAEPDSLDFEILGNRRNGVLAGCAVTSLGTSTSVAVSAGTVIIDGKSYNVSAAASLALPAAPSDSRFDLIVARESGGGASLVVVQGAESSSNPVFPQSMSVYGGSFSATTNIDFSTDTVLASCLRTGSATVTTKDVVDKRVMVPEGVIYQGSTLPLVADNGTLFFKTDEATSGSGVTASGLYVRANATWLPLAQSNANLGVPIGSTIWHNSATPPTGYLVEDGSAVSRTTYAALFAVIGTTYGAGDGSTTFNLPNTVGKMVRGAANAGGSGGSDSVTLLSANMPSHTHDMSHAHLIDHTHSVTHDHAAVATTSNGGHTHDNTFSIDNAGGHNHGIPYFLIVNAPTTPQVAYWLDVISYPSGDIGAYTNQTAVTSSVGDHSHTLYGSISSVNSHAHTVDIPSLSVTSGASSRSNTGDMSTTVTSATGSGTAFSNLPAYVEKVPCIRAV